MYVWVWSLTTTALFSTVLLISAAFEHSVLHVWEIYALENVVLYIAVYGLYKP